MGGGHDFRIFSDEMGKRFWSFSEEMEKSTFLNFSFKIKKKFIWFAVFSQFWVKPDVPVGIGLTS